eukprot:Em0123g6a
MKHKRGERISEKLDSGINSTLTIFEILSTAEPASAIAIQSEDEDLRLNEAEQSDRKLLEEISNTSTNFQQRPASCAGYTNFEQSVLEALKNIERHLCDLTSVRSVHTASAGCWLGDPNTHINEGKKTWIVDGDEKKIAMTGSVSDTPAKLAVAILTSLFSMEELGAGRCTPAKDQNTLNPVYI